jgi:CheY-like chemotaxis protein
MVSDNRKKILILENDDCVLWALKDAFETKGYKTWATWSGQEAIGLLRSVEFDVMLTASYLADMHIGDFLHRVKRMTVQPWIVVMEDSMPPRVDRRRCNVFGISALVNKNDPVKIQEVVSSCCAGGSLAKTIVH